MKNLLYRTKSGRRKGSLGLVLDSDAALEAVSTNGAAAAPGPADAVDEGRRPRRAASSTRPRRSCGT